MWELPPWYVWLGSLGFTGITRVPEKHKALYILSTDTHYACSALLDLVALCWMWAGYRFGVLHVPSLSQLKALCSAAHCREGQSLLLWH